MLRSVLHAALCALATVLVALPASASAASDQTFPVGGADFERARAIAIAHWGGANPCQGNVAYRWAGLEPLTNARATWSNPTDAWANPGANFDCEIVFNQLTQYDFAMLCTVMAHEVGHLLGHPHDAAAGQLMSAIYTAPISSCAGNVTTAPSQPAGDGAGDGDPVAWSVSEPKARKKSKKAKTAKKSAKRKKRCVVRFKAGKRVKRCVTLKKQSARKGRKARSARKARTSGNRLVARTYVAH